MNWTCHVTLNHFVKFNIPFYSKMPIESPRGNSDPIIVDIADNINLSLATKTWNNAGFTNVIFLTSNINEANGNNVIYFPSWLYSCSAIYSRMQVPTIGKRKYSVSCLNRNCMPHKLYTYLQFIKREYLSKSLVSFSGSYCVDAQLRPIDFDDYPFQTLPQSIINEAKNSPLYLEVDDKQWINDHSFLHPAFTDSYLNITTETQYIFSLFTEKTAKPLVGGQLFLQTNGPNSIAGLKHLNIETFDSDLDPLYDSFPVYTDRIDQMFLLLDKLFPNLEDIYYSNLAKIKYNQEYFLSTAFRSNMEKTLKERGLIVK